MNNFVSSASSYSVASIPDAEYPVCPNHFTLVEIFSSAKEKTITLPTVQRGFVWKPHQIENLWDSLLRGYPVGAFVLSNRAESKQGYELLDGQQRATAICLGFFNPADKTDSSGEIFKSTNENVMIFIDLVKPKNDQSNRKYIFRVITKSHPWGYSQQDNQKTLDSNLIGKARECYELSDESKYWEIPLSKFWPYDAHTPIPVGILLAAAKKDLDIEDVNSEIKNWRNDREIKTARSAEGDLYEIEEIYCAVKKMLAKQKIPLLYLDVENLYTDETNADTQQSQADGDGNSEAGEDDIETLFVRLNAGGTPLRGEELNYSVLKSHIDAELQEKIEDVCSGFCQPARFISLGFRLFNHLPHDKSSQGKSKEAGSINLRVTPKQFQRSIRASKLAFVKFIQNDLLSGEFVSGMKNMLTFNKEGENDIGLPAILVGKLADECPEVIFMLMYRLLIKKDAITELLRPRVLGMVTLFIWLGKGEKQKDHSKLLKLIWPCVEIFDTERFWSSETVQRAMILEDDNEILTPFPSLKWLIKTKNLFPKLDIRSWVRPEKWALDSKKYSGFINKLSDNRDILLYAQRKFLSDTDVFPDANEFTFEDINRTFDWDHISPHSAIRNKRNIRPELKKWYSSNGNFRAWPYSLNRQDQDSSPQKKLEDNNKVRNILGNSFCTKEWLEIGKDDLDEVKKNARSKKIASCIIRRNLEIIQEWNEQLDIDKLLPEDRNAKDIVGLFKNVLNKKIWETEQPKKSLYVKHRQAIKGNKDWKLTLQYDTDNNVLSEGEIYFGLFTENEKAYKNIRIPKEVEGDYQSEAEDSTNSFYLGSYFTLISDSNASIIHLFKDFLAWIEAFPDSPDNSNLKNKIREAFIGGIKIEYKKKLEVS